MKKHQPSPPWVPHAAAALGPSLPPLLPPLQVDMEYVYLHVHIIQLEPGSKCVLQHGSHSLSCS